jgi:hypothetical protein
MRARVIPGFVQQTVAGGRILVVLDKEAADRGPPAVRATSAGRDLNASGAFVNDPALETFQTALRVRGAVPYAFTLDAPMGDQVDVTVSVIDPTGTRLEPIAQRSFAPVPKVVPPDGLRITIATCYYDYGRGATSYAEQLRVTPFGPPHLKILAGDNVYMDVVPGQLFHNDANRETADVYAQYFVDGDYHKVLESSPNVTTWDDHELWNNYPEEQIHLSRSSGASAARFAQAANAGIELFQRPLNPDGANPFERSFEFKIDPISFFVADLRSRRTLHSAQPRGMMPQAELFNLTHWARHLTAPGVLVLGQPLWIEPGDEYDYTPPNFEEQYGQIWAALEDSKFDILVLTGDVHHSRVLSIGVRRGWVHEVTSSPAVHIPTKLGTGWGSIFGGSHGQDRGKVAYPGAVPVDPKFGVAPRLDSLLFAHDEPNTFAALRLTAIGSDRVDVGIAMIDHQTGTIPSSKGSHHHSPRLASCSSEGAFSLLRR